MKLHRLTLQAIGPFAGRVEVDFARLGQGGLFLLEGPTGSGKSTVIDALTFALYGRVAATTSSAERLRSHHAELAVESFVDLVFETQCGVFRVRRTAPFDRPRRDGSGVRRVPATVKVWRLTTPDSAVDLQPLSTRVAEADDEILRAIGLNHAQFVQTVVLPQNEFATFLQSRSDDKKALLHRLFGTEVVAAAQAALIEARRAAEQSREVARAAVEEAVRAFGVASGADDDAVQALLEATAEAAEACADEAADRLRTIVTATLTELRTADAAAAGAQDSARDARVQVAAELEFARDLERRRHRRATLVSRGYELASRTDGMVRARAELEASERAIAAISAADALAQALAELARMERCEAASRTALPPELREASEAGLRSASAEHHSSIGRLQEAAAREGRLAALAKERAAVIEQRDGLVEALDAVYRERAVLPERIASADAEYRRLDAVAARLPALVGEHGRALLRLRSAEDAMKAEQALSVEIEITEAAHAAWAAQEERLAQLRVSWRAGVAGELGVALQAGSPCDVCGSIEHPHPARVAPDAVSRDDVDRAGAEATRLRQTLERAGRNREEQRAELVRLQVLADQLTPEQAQRTLDEIAGALAVAQEAAVGRDGVAARIAEDRRRADELGELLTGFERRLGEAEQLGRTLTTLLQDDTALVDQARGDFESVGSRIDFLRVTARHCAETAEAAAATAGSLARAVRCRDEFRAELEKAGFDDEPQWRAAVRSSTEQRELRRAISEFDRELVTISEQLAEPELNDARLDDPAADMVEIGARLAAAEAHEHTVSERAGALRERRTDAEHRAGEVERALATATATLRSTAAAIRLGLLAAGNGDNQLRMDLTTFVLIRRFGEVIAAANEQLRRISSGRYQLEHTDARSGNARSGLGLLVLDLQTGRSRDPATLSGGETFYVSLSLALGLADVVRAESGGVDLGTLFIDEGFGSLDPDVLDEVLGALDSLRAGGRSVGLVSHVSELKVRIGDRIAVRRLPDGSSHLQLTA